MLRGGAHRLRGAVRGGVVQAPRDDPARAQPRHRRARAPAYRRSSELGVVALERARRLLGALAETDEHIAETVSGRRGRLRVSATPLWMRTVVERAGERAGPVILAGSAAGLRLLAGGPWLSWFPLAFLARNPELGLKPLPLTFGRHRYRTGLGARPKISRRCGCSRTSSETSRLNGSAEVWFRSVLRSAPPSRCCCGHWDPCRTVSPMARLARDGGNIALSVTGRGSPPTPG